MNRRQFLASTGVLATGIVLGDCQSKNINFRNPSRKTIQRAVLSDSVNGNKRLYPLSVLQKIVKDFEELPPRTMMGELGLTSGAIVHITEISHVITGLHIIEGKYISHVLVADIELLDTPCGKQLENMLEDMCFRTRGTQTGGYMGENSILTVNETYKLIAIDAIPRTRCYDCRLDRVT